MARMIINTVVVLFGLLMVLFRDAMAKNSFNFYEKLKWPHCSENAYKVIYLCVGIVFLIFGILSLFGVIKYR